MVFGGFPVSQVAFFLALARGREGKALFLWLTRVMAGIFAGVGSAVGLMLQIHVDVNEHATSFEMSFFTSSIYILYIV